MLCILYFCFCFVHDLFLIFVLEIKTFTIMYLTIYDRTTYLIHSHFATRYHSFREMLKVTSYDKKHWLTSHDQKIQSCWVSCLIVCFDIVDLYCWGVLLVYLLCLLLTSSPQLGFCFGRFGSVLSARRFVCSIIIFLCLCPLQSRAFPWS